MATKSTTVQANALWQKQPKVNSELFALTYGALVGELLRDLEKTDLIQSELDRMGHSMGIRSAEEFLARSDMNCKNFSDTPEVLKMALRMFFGVAADTRSKSDDSMFSVLFSDNPLTLFVELPDEYETLEYSQLLAGWCRGVLEMLQFDCACKVEQSMLTGDAVNEISISLNQVLQEGAGEEYQEE